MCAWKSREDRKSTRLNSSHSSISYAVFCLKKKKRAEGAAPARPPEQLTKVLNRGLRSPDRRPVSAGRSCGRLSIRQKVFFFNDTAATEIYTLALHDALPI